MIIKHKLNILMSVIMLTGLHSCVSRPILYNHTAEIVELGNNYYYLGDGRESQILLDDTPEAKHKSGAPIIPPEVIQYNYDDNFIIAKTEDIESKNGELIKYWIVEKNRKSQDSVISLDSAGFYKKIDSLQIKIKLKDR